MTWRRKGHEINEMNLFEKFLKHRFGDISELKPLVLLVV